MPSLQMILIIAPPILLALTFHECAHAYVAYRLGDPTAKNLGRLTLNPLAHLDIIGTIMVFIIHIGWAKPVPVNPMNFKNPKKDLLWVSLAGPLANVFLAFIFGILFRTLNTTAQNPLAEIIKVMIIYGVLINLILAFFNIIPLPPLDGSKILAGIIPSEYESSFEQFMKYGQFILLGLIVLSIVFNIPIFSYFYKPFVKYLSYLFAGESFI